jgi:hypothetical protein
MPDTDFIEQLRGRLVELGCPKAHVRRLVREVAEHREDLKQAAVLEGLSGADAESQANAQLGDPIALAEHLMVAVRRSSWSGRHFVVTFGLLPLLAFPVLWLLLMIIELSLGFALGFGWDYKKLHVAAINPVANHHINIALRSMDYAAITLVALLFCWLARRSAVSAKWMVTSCAICSFYALVTYGRVEPHSFTMGFITSTAGIPPIHQCIKATIPLLIAGVFYVFQRRAKHELRRNATA